MIFLLCEAHRHNQVPNQLYHHHLPPIIIIITTNLTNPIPIAEYGHKRCVYILLTMMRILSLHSLAHSSPSAAIVSKQAKPYLTNSCGFTSVRSNTCNCITTMSSQSKYNNQKSKRKKKTSPNYSTLQTSTTIKLQSFCLFYYKTRKVLTFFKYQETF